MAKTCWRETNIPSGIFRGANFMTPNVIEHYRRTMRGRVAYVEISEGTGMSREPIYGVTFRYADGSELWRNGEKDPSACVYSLEAARELAKTAE